MKAKLDINNLPGKKEGYTVKEIAKRFNTSSDVVNTWLSKIRNGHLPGLKVTRIRTDDRFIVNKCK